MISLKTLSRDDGEAADEALVQPEHKIDLAPTGLPEPSETTPASVSA